MMPRHSSPWRTRLLTVALCSALSACGLMPHAHPKPDPVVARVLPPPTPRTDGAIYQSGQQIELFADLKARRVGDVLTIRLTEVTNASKSAVTKTTKTTIRKQYRSDDLRQNHHRGGRTDFHHDIGRRR